MRDWSKLHAATAEIAIREPELQRSLREPWQDSALSIQKEVESALGAIMSDRIDTAKGSESKLDPLLMLYDIHTLNVCDMAYFAWKNRQSKSAIIWPDATLPTRPKRNDVFLVLVSNLSHAMQAFRLLSIHGFEHQSRNTLRNLLELMDIMIATLSRESFYVDYVRSYERDADVNKHWQAKLKPSLVRKLLAELDADDPILLPIDWSSVDIRRDMYDWLSKFSHNNFVSHIVAAHPPEPAGGMRPLGMLGTVGAMSRATFAQALVYLWISSIRLQRLLWQTHKWGNFRGARSRRWAGYRFAVIDELSRACLPRFWESEPDIQ